MVMAATGVPQQYYASSPPTSPSAASPCSPSTTAASAARCTARSGGEGAHARLGAARRRRCLRFLARNFAKDKLLVIGHSFGGQALGLLPKPERIAAALIVGSQSGYWRHWPLPFGRAWMWAAAHIGMRLTPHLLGYFPGSRLGLGEDLPAGVAARMGELVPPPALPGRRAGRGGGIRALRARRCAPTPSPTTPSRPPRAVEALAGALSHPRAEMSVARRRAM